MTTLCFDATVDAGFGIPGALSDASYRRLVVADGYAELLMRPKDSLIHLPWQATAHPEDFQMLELPISRTVGRGEPFEQRCRVLRGDGTWLNLVYKLTASHDKRSGRIVIQSNVRVCQRQQDQSAASSRASPATQAEYIRDMTQQLGRLAGGHRMALLQHFLAMASAEAEQELERMAEASRLLDRGRAVIH